MRARCEFKAVAAYGCDSHVLQNDRHDVELTSVSSNRYQTGLFPAMRTLRTCSVSHFPLQRGKDVAWLSGLSPVRLPHA